MTKTKTLKIDHVKHPMGLLSVHVFWCVAFIVIPLLFVLYYMMIDGNGVFTFDNIKYLGTKEILQCFGRSLIYAASSTAVCLLLGYPLALIISRMPTRRQTTMNMLIMIPMWVSFIIRTYTIKDIFNTNGIINKLLRALHILEEGDSLKFIGTPGLIIFGMVYNFLPYMVVPIVTSLTGIDNRLFEASADLGASPWKTLLHVTLPLSRAGIISGITMVFVPAVSTFYISSTLSGGTVTLIGDKIEMAFLNESNFSRGSALSFVLMILIIISMLIMNKFGDRNVEGVTV